MLPLLAGNTADPLGGVADTWTRYCVGTFVAWFSTRRFRERVRRTGPATEIS